MLYLYIGSIIISYLITKKCFTKVEDSLNNQDLNVRRSYKDKENVKLYLLIIACIPFINLIISIYSLINKDYLYNAYIKTECENYLQDNEELLIKYEKACNLKNKYKRRTLEKEINDAIMSN